MRDAGATPATIALIDGVVHVGLESAELDRIANDDLLLVLIPFLHTPIVVSVIQWYASLKTYGFSAGFILLPFFLFTKLKILRSFFRSFPIYK